MLPDLHTRLINFPILDLTLPSIPQRSRFYPLSPIGVGTPYVESLTSYICRLVAFHNVSVGSFYEYLLIPNLHKHYLAAPRRLAPASTLAGALRKQIKAINGVGQMAREWFQLLESLTLRSDLRFLSLSVLSDVTPHWKLLRTFQTWCPTCYQETLETNQPVYQPLLWLIAAVDICARHRRRLVNRCPHCHQQFPPLPRRAFPGYCARCGYWLGEIHDDRVTLDALLPEEEIDWHISIAKSAEDLLAGLPSLAGSITREKVVGSLQECISISTGGVGAQFSNLIKKNSTTVQGWHKGKVKIPLCDMFRICYCLDLSILDFLKGSQAIRKSGINIKELPSAYQTVRKRPTPRPFNHIRVKSELAKFLDMEPPISLREATARIGVDHRDIYRKFPELSRKISSRYIVYMRDYYRTKRSRREEEVRQAVIHLYSQGIYVSPRPVAQYLNKPSYLGRRDVAFIIRETREWLDSERKAR